MKIWPLVLGLLLLLVLGGGGAAAYYILQNQQPTAEERFQYAIAAHLQTPYINQDYTIHLDQNDLTADITIKSSMDVTEPASPKIAGSYTLTSNKTLERTVNFAVSSKTKAYMSFDQAETLSASNLQPKTWYSYDPSNPVLTLAVDPFGIISKVGTSRGEIPVGQFTDEQQATILNQVSSASPYTIASVADEGEHLRYDITINSDNYKKLDAVVAKLVDDTSESVSDTATTDTPAQIWIDKETNRIVKYSHKKDKNSVTVAITYPPQYDSTAPKDSVDLMKTLQASTPSAGAQQQT